MFSPQISPIKSKNNLSVILFWSLYLLLLLVTLTQLTMQMWRFFMTLPLYQSPRLETLEMFLACCHFHPLNCP